MDYTFVRNFIDTNPDLLTTVIRLVEDGDFEEFDRLIFHRLFFEGVLSASVSQSLFEQYQYEIKEGILPT